MAFLVAAGMAFAAGEVLPASAQSAPTVTRVSPSSGPVKGGQTIVITGTGFTGTTAVKFGAAGTNATSFAIMNDKQIVAVVPDASAAGAVLMEVTNGTGANTTGANYTYLAPKVTKVDPGWADKDGSGRITITGEGFTGALAADVQFDNDAVQAVWVISDKQMVVQPAADSSGSVPYGQIDVVVTRNSVASATSDSSKFVFTSDIPTITQLEDGSSTQVTGTDGVAVGGTMTIIGTRLWGLDQVAFGTTRVTNSADITVASDGNSATVVVPNRSAGPIDVVATNAAGDSVTNLNTVYSYYSSSAPTITRIYPEAIDKTNTTGGGTVLITGRGLTGVGTGQITLTCATGTPTATSATSISDTSLVVVLSHNAGTAESCDVTIENPTDNTKTVTRTAGVRYV
ncbi:MAG: IPT/TIG domain-containing protein [Actinomycetota bacterium]